jgi:hypothetical protein
MQPGPDYPWAERHQYLLQRLSATLSQIAAFDSLAAVAGVPGVLDVSVPCCAPSKRPRNAVMQQRSRVDLDIRQSTLVLPSVAVPFTMSSASSG